MTATCCLQNSSIAQALRWAFVTYSNERVLVEDSSRRWFGDPSSDSYAVDSTIEVDTALVIIALSMLVPFIIFQAIPKRRISSKKPLNTWVPKTKLIRCVAAEWRWYKFMYGYPDDRTLIFSEADGGTDKEARMDDVDPEWIYMTDMIQNGIEMSDKAFQTYVSSSSQHLVQALSLIMCLQFARYDLDGSGR